MATLVDWRQGEQAKSVIPVVGKIPIPVVGEILIPKGTEITIREKDQKDKKVTVQKAKNLNTSQTYYCTIEGSKNNLIAIQDNYYNSEQKIIMLISFPHPGLLFNVDDVRS